jgi:hypothetical protein
MPLRENTPAWRQADLQALIAYLRTIKPVKESDAGVKNWAPVCGAQPSRTPIFLNQLRTLFRNAPEPKRRQMASSAAVTWFDHVSLVRRLPYTAKFPRRAQAARSTWRG